MISKILVSLLALSLFTSGLGLSAQEQCSQATCDVLAQMLVCEAFGIEMPRICAKYLLGSQMDCPKYPHDLLDAPYICRDYYGSLPVVNKLLTTDYTQQPVQSIKAAAEALRSVKKAGDDMCLADNILQALGAGPMGYDSFQELCAVDCFQTYLIRLNNMFIKCAVAPIVSDTAPVVEEQTAAAEVSDPIVEPEMPELPPTVIPDLGDGLPDADAIDPAQLQMCTYNPLTDQYCLDAAGGSDTALDFRCPYPPDALPTITAMLCQQFQPLGCCMGTLVTMGQRTDDVIIPPCVFKMLSTCPVPVTANDFCETGLMTNVSTMVVTYQFVQKVPGKSILPNMYNETEVRMLMNAFADCFSTVPITADMATITNFTYADSDGNPINNFAQVVAAASATYTIQLSVVASKSPQVIGALHPFVPTYIFAGMMARRFGLEDEQVDATCIDAKGAAFLVPLQYEPDAATSLVTPNLGVLLAVALAAVLSFVR